MKKRIIISLFTLCSFVAVQAKVNFGIKTGLNVANIEEITADNVFEQGSYTGFYMGPKIDWDMTKWLGINGSILYSQAGMKFDNSEEVINLNSLMLPVNLSLKLFGSHMFGLYIEAGPQFEFNLGQKVSEFEEGQLHFDNSTLSLNVGASLHLFGFLQLGANYNVPFGSTSDFDFDDIDNEELYDVYNVQVSATIMF